MEWSPRQELLLNAVHRATSAIALFVVLFDTCAGAIRAARFDLLLPPDVAHVVSATAFLAAIGIFGVVLAPDILGGLVSAGIGVYAVTNMWQGPMMEGLLVTPGNVALLGVVLVAVGLGVLRCLHGVAVNGAAFLKRRQGKPHSPHFPAGRWWSHRGLVGAWLVATVAAGVAFGLAYTPLVETSITIEPRDYQAKFGFWGGFNISEYRPEECAELDEHGAIIYAYDVPVRNYATPSDWAWVNETMHAWHARYPRVKFSFSIHGEGGIWEGAMDMYDTAKNWCQAALEEPWPNFYGVIFDWEHDPVEQETPLNATRREHAREAYRALFTWRDAHCPAFNISVVPGFTLSFDPLDGDDDVSKLIEILPWEGDFDEFAPQIYRCHGDAASPGPADYYGAAPFTYTYTKMAWLEAGLAAAGKDPEAISVFLGFTNCTCYGAAHDQFNGSQVVGKGFDALVIDYKICKAFGAPVITLFIGEPTLGTPPNTIGGPFDSYGLTFLDRLNASVNGPGSTEPFSLVVRSVGDKNYFYFTEDAWLDFQHPGNEWYYLAGTLGPATLALAGTWQVPGGLGGKRSGPRGSTPRTSSEPVGLA